MYYSDALNCIMSTPLSRFCVHLLQYSPHDVTCVRRHRYDVSQISVAIIISSSKQVRRNRDHFVLTRNKGSYLDIELHTQHLT